MNISKHWRWGDVDYLCLSDCRETEYILFSTSTHWENICSLPSVAKFVVASTVPHFPLLLTSLGKNNQDYNSVSRISGSTSLD